jgi:WD40 repeat protein
MDNRYTEIVEYYVKQAFEQMYAYDANDEKYEAFASKWSGFAIENMKQALEQGEGDDRLCAMFALSFSNMPDAERLLLPFLHSRRLEERCISAIALGMSNNEHAYPFLETLMLSGLSLDERLPTSQGDDQEPGLSKGLLLCDFYRQKMITLLEHRDSPTLIWTLTQALKAIWALERSSYPVFMAENCYASLLFILGQRGVFTVVDDVGFIPAYKRVAMIYLALGYLHIEANPTLMRAVFDKETRQNIAQCLHEFFQLDEHEIHRCIQSFFHEGGILSAFRNHETNEAIEQALDRGFTVKMEDYSEVAYEEEEEEKKEESIQQVEPSNRCVYRGHALPVFSLSWSPDGKQIVSGSADKTAQVWNCQTGKRTVLFKEHTASVNVVAWSPNGQWVASGGSDNRMFIWEAQSGNIITKYEKHAGWICNGLAWSPDGTLIASASWDSTVHVWEALTGKTRSIYRGHNGVVTSVAWSPDGTRIVSGGGYPECAIHVWESATGHLIYVYKDHMQDTEKIRPLPAALLKDEYDEAWGRGPSSVRSLAWSPDGQWIASVGLRNVFRVWNAQTGENRLALSQNRTIGSLVWSARSQFLSAASWDGLDVWKLDQKRVMSTYIPSNRSLLLAATYSPDHGSLAVGGLNPDICVWHIETS